MLGFGAVSEASVSELPNEHDGEAICNGIVTIVPWITVGCAEMGPRIETGAPTLAAWISTGEITIGCGD
jgi:hypothetical protein